MTAHSMAQRIELWPLDRLVPYARNPRTHSDEQVAQIAASIAEFGFNNPILVDSKDGIIAGHGRLSAARKLGLDHVPVVILDHLTEAEKRAYIIADNKLALNAGWDEELLKTELAELRDADFDIGVIGFSDEELEELLADEPLAGLTDENACPEPPTVAVSQPGDLWILGPHRVLCADCTNADAVSRLLGKRKPILMVTDPPYGIELDSEWRDRAGLNGCGPAEASCMKHRTEGHTNTSISSDTRDGTTWISELIERAIRIASTASDDPEALRIRLDACAYAGAFRGFAPTTSLNRHGCVRLEQTKYMPMGPKRALPIDVPADAASLEEASAILFVSSHGSTMSSVRVRISARCCRVGASSESLSGRLLQRSHGVRSVRADVCVPYNSARRILIRRQASARSKSQATRAWRTISTPPSNSGWTTRSTPASRNSGTL